MMQSVMRSPSSPLRILSKIESRHVFQPAITSGDGEVKSGQEDTDVGAEVFRDEAIWWKIINDNWDRSEEISLLNSLLRENVKRVVDYGCGTGHPGLAAIWDASLDYVGVEWNPAQLAQHPASTGENALVSLRTESITDTSATAGRGDLALCLWVLHTRRQAETMVNALYERLASKARLVIIVPSTHAEAYSALAPILCPVLDGIDVQDPSQQFAEIEAVILSNARGRSVARRALQGRISLPLHPAERIELLAGLGRHFAPHLPLAVIRSRLNDAADRYSLQFPIRETASVFIVGSA